MKTTVEIWQHLIDKGAVTADKGKTYVHLLNGMLVDNKNTKKAYTFSEPERWEKLEGFNKDFNSVEDIWEHLLNGGAVEEVKTGKVYYKDDAPQNFYQVKRWKVHGVLKGNTFDSKSNKLTEIIWKLIKKELEYVDKEDRFVIVGKALMNIFSKIYKPIMVFKGDI